MAPIQMSSENPKFDQLMESFDRWGKAVLRSDTVFKAPSLMRGINLEDFETEHNLPPATKTIRSLSSLPGVSIDDLAPNEQECSICQEGFATEVPIRIPCGHVFGDQCFQNWMFPYGDGENCPLCRARDIPISRRGSFSDSTDLLHSYELRMDELAWTDFDGGKLWSHEERAVLLRALYEITCDRLLEAQKESLKSCPMKAKFEETLHWRERRAKIDDTSKVLKKCKAMYLSDETLAEGDSDAQ